MTLEAKAKSRDTQLLRAIFEQLGTGTESRKDTRDAIVSEIAMVAYFFAMSCEITATATPGRTKIMCLKGVVFRDARHREIPHSLPAEIRVARRVTVTFGNQKNGLKMHKRTHMRTNKRTGDIVLCPVRLLTSQILRVLSSVPNAGPETPVSTIQKAEGSVLSRAPSCDGAFVRRARREEGPVPSDTAQTRLERGQSDPVSRWGCSL